MKDARLELRLDKKTKSKVKMIAIKKGMTVTELVLLGICKLIAEDENYKIKKE